jgi:hydroxymethylpyrimidine pyrophosphatase-like HAD family hydrolase
MNKLPLEFTNLFIDFLRQKHHLIITSDFDETLVNTYHYDDKTKIHLPVISAEMKKAINSFQDFHQFTFILYTARAENERVLEDICKIHSGLLVIENGGLIRWEDGKISNLLHSEDKQMILNVKQRVRDNQPKLIQLFARIGYELIVRLGRTTDIEFRIQKTGGKGLSPQEESLYDILIEELCNIVEPGKLVSIFTGSTLALRLPYISELNALKTILEEKKIVRSKSKILAIGDSDNDRDIFEYADMSVNVGWKPLVNKEYLLGGGEKSALAVFQFIQSYLKK